MVSPPVQPSPHARGLYWDKRATWLRAMQQEKKFTPAYQKQLSIVLRRQKVSTLANFEAITPRAMLNEETKTATNTVTPRATLIPGAPMAPDFELPDLDGQTWTLAQFRGQPVMLFYWATW